MWYVVLIPELKFTCSKIDFNMFRHSFLFHTVEISMVSRRQLNSSSTVGSWFSVFTAGIHNSCKNVLKHKKFLSVK